MLKWIGGCLVLVIVLLAGGSWFAMRTMRDSLEPDGSARVTIAAPAARVYSLLSDGDSIRIWMAQGNTVTTWRHGPLALGDTIRVELPQSLGVSQRPITWRVSEVAPNRAVGMELLAYPSGRVIGIRRDSLAMAGDSTVVVSTVTSTVLTDSTQSGTRGMAADMMLSMLRLQRKLELQVLKSHVEKKS